MSATSTDGEEDGFVAYPDMCSSMLLYLLYNTITLLVPRMSLSTIRKNLRHRYVEDKIYVCRFSSQARLTSLDQHRIFYTCRG